MNTVTRRAHAKINLTLDVGIRRADGYHDIRSVMQTLALHDTLTVSRTPDAPGVRLEVAGDEAEGVPADETNLVHRAAVRLQKIAAARGMSPRDSSLHIALMKRIPSQAGLGGGSSDAAAALRAGNDLLGLDLSPARLAEIGAALGADVPFFLHGGTALAEGLGEKVTPLPPLPVFSVVVVKPPVGVSTSAAYAALDSLPNREGGRATDGRLRGEWTLGNDFETVILPSYPQVAAAYHALRWTDGVGESFTPLLCGSGSCVFRLVADLQGAARLADRVRAADVGKVWVTQTAGVGGDE